MCWQQYVCYIYDSVFTKWMKHGRPDANKTHLQPRWGGIKCKELRSILQAQKTGDIQSSFSLPKTSTVLVTGGSAQNGKVPSLCEPAMRRCGTRMRIQSRQTGFYIFSQIVLSDMNPTYQMTNSGNCPWSASACRRWLSTSCLTSFIRPPSNTVVLEEQILHVSLPSMQRGLQKQGLEVGREATDSVNGADIESGTMIPAMLNGKHTINSLCWPVCVPLRANAVWPRLCNLKLHKHENCVLLILRKQLSCCRLCKKTIQTNSYLQCQTWGEHSVRCAAPGGERLSDHSSVAALLAASPVVVFSKSRCPFCFEVRLHRTWSHGWFGTLTCGRLSKCVPCSD